VFFDTLGVKWEYEKEGFELSSGRYLPDFYFPEFESWAEVKGEEPEDRALRLADELRRGLNQHVLVLSGSIGLPDTDELGLRYPWSKVDYTLRFYPGHYNMQAWPYVYDPTLAYDEDRWQSLRVHLRYNGYRSKPYDGSWESIDALIDLDRAYYQKRYGEPHPFWTHGPVEEHAEWAVGRHGEVGISHAVVWNHPLIIEATDAARSARFER
jgi:hypothetical protein